MNQLSKYFIFVLTEIKDYILFIIQFINKHQLFGSNTYLLPFIYLSNGSPEVMLQSTGYELFLHDLQEIL